MIRRLTIMLREADVAQASLALTPERTYYRFATEDSIEDGELAPIADFAAVAQTIAEAALPQEGEHPLPPETKMQVFVNNVVMRQAPTRESMRRVVDLLMPLAPEFAFVGGFSTRG